MLATVWQYTQSETFQSIMKSCMISKYFLWTLEAFLVSGHVIKMNDKWFFSWSLNRLTIKLINDCKKYFHCQHRRCVCVWKLQRVWSLLALLGSYLYPLVKLLWSPLGKHRPTLAPPQHIHYNSTLGGIFNFNWK